MAVEQNSDENKFPGQSFVSALEEYTTRVDSLVAQVESQSEGILSGTIFTSFGVSMVATLVPISSLIVPQTQSNYSLRILIQIIIATALIAAGTLVIITFYSRTLRLRRYRRNLETLLWPYQKLLQKLSQILDHANLDEGTSTLIQLKILEAEVVYGRARRILDTRSVVGLLFGTNRSEKFDGGQVAKLARELAISFEDAERLMVLYWPDRERIRQAASDLRSGSKSRLI